MSNSKFKVLIYQYYAPDEVVVVFKIWGGIERSSYVERVKVSDLGKCDRNVYMRPFPLSSRLQHDALLYKEKFMPKAIANGYISVMVRLEQFSIRNMRFRGQSNYLLCRLCTKILLGRSIFLKPNTVLMRFF